MKFLVLSDTQVGSVYGIWHPKFITKNRISYSISRNYVIQALWHDWTIMAKELEMNPVDFAVLNGDLVDGVQRLDYGRQAMTTDMDDQMNCFTELYDMLRPGIKNPEMVYCTTGSDYHESKYGEYHYQICKELTKDPDEFWLGTGGDIHINNYTINVAHGSSSAFVYIEQVQARERMFMLNAAELKKVDYADLILRAHLHKFSHVEAAGKRLRDYEGLIEPAVTSQKCVIGPAFQGQTQFMEKKQRYKLIPDIGYIIVTIDDKGVHFKERLFKPIKQKLPRKDPLKYMRKLDIKSQDSGSLRGPGRPKKQE